MAACSQAAAVLLLPQLVLWLQVLLWLQQMPLHVLVLLHNQHHALTHPLLQQW
jgi:hypothetical protein